MAIFFKKKHHKVKHSSNAHDLHYRVITSESPNSIASEAYRRIKVGLEFSDIDTKLQVLQICSATQGEGKTITLLNIGATYVEDGYKVLLVDLDLRRPKLHRSMKIKNENGLSDLLAGKITKEEAIKRAPNGMYILNSGTKTPYPTSLIGSSSLENLFQELRKDFDYILVDCAPILAVSDAIIISRLADGCLFVVSQQRTEKGVARDAVNLLKTNNVNLIGVVYTEISKHNSSYYSYRYKYYYQNYGTNKSIEEENDSIEKAFIEDTKDSEAVNNDNQQQNLPASNNDDECDYIFADDGSRLLLNKSFECKLHQTNDVVKNYYNDIKNEILSYLYKGKIEKIRNNISWKHEIFIMGYEKLCKIKIKRRNLLICLPLDPKQFEGTKYKVLDGSKARSTADLPTIFAIKNDRRKDYAFELIKMVMEPLGLKKVDVPYYNYAKDYPFATNKELLDRGLIKVDGTNEKTIAKTSYPKEKKETED